CGGGAVYHGDDCGHVSTFSKQSAKCIAVKWESDIDREISVQIHVDTVNKTGALAEVAATIADSQSNIEQVSVLDRHDDCSVLTFLLQVKDRNHLARIMANVRKMPNVIRVARACA